MTRATKMTTMSGHIPPVTMAAYHSVSSIVRRRCISDAYTNTPGLKVAVHRLRLCFLWKPYAPGYISLLLIAIAQIL